MLRITPTLTIDEDELAEEFVRASGPGGQNVNKVATAVQLRFDLARSPSIPDAVRRRALRLAGQRLTKEGVLVITADRFRTQMRNREDARERLVELLREAATPPKPRIASRPPRAAKERRLESKARRSDVKRGRQTRLERD
jgi:ribosome-associated protein